MIKFKDKYKMEQEVKKYICICGKEFDNSQSFNGHRSHCKVYLESKGIDYAVYQETKKAKCKDTKQSSKLKHTAAVRTKKDKPITQWIEEKHVCERCGKVMTEKYGSGRFCCRSCANARHHSEDTKQKIKASFHKTIDSRTTEEKLHIRNQIINRCKDEYMKNPCYCKVCGNLVPYERKNKNYCSRECAYANSGGYRQNASYGKFGTYKGVYCDSTYELAFLIYCLDHNIQIERCTTYFMYEYEGSFHKYYPDFYLPESDTYIETKGQMTELVYIKAKAVPNNKLLLLDTEALEPVFQYLNSNYPVTCNKSNNNLYILYDQYMKP